MGNHTTSELAGSKNGSLADMNRFKKRSLPLISCTTTPCGACCQEQGGLPVSMYLGDHPLDSPTHLPPELYQSLLDIQASWLAHGFLADSSPCIWYDINTRLCKHYEYRPSICRNVVIPGDFHCLSWRKAKGIDPTRKFIFRDGRLVLEDSF
jgi:uncharacterized protein